MTVSADGSEVVRTDDTDDLDEDDRQGIDAAGISVVDAVTAALAEADGTFDDVGLESDGGAHFWEVSLDAPSGGDDIEVRVTVADGTATVHRDDD